MSYSGRILSCRRGVWWWHLFLGLGISHQCFHLLWFSHLLFVIHTPWPPGLFFFLRCWYFCGLIWLDLHSFSSQVALLLLCVLLLRPASNAPPVLFILWWWLWLRCVIFVLVLSLCPFSALFISACRVSTGKKSQGNSRFRWSTLVRPWPSSGCTSKTGLSGCFLFTTTWTFASQNDLSLPGPPLSVRFRIRTHLDAALLPESFCHRVLFLFSHWPVPPCWPACMLPPSRVSTSLHTPHETHYLHRVGCQTCCQLCATAKEQVIWCISRRLISCDIICMYDFIQRTFPICFDFVIQISQHGQ